MPRYVFDIETNGLLDDLTTLHCLVMQDLDTGAMLSCASQPGHTLPEDGVRALMAAEEIIGHNIIKFDIPALQKLFPWFRPKGRVIDTLVCTRLLWPEIKQDDFKRQKAGRLPGKLVGSHSLEAWGHRIGNYKGEFGKTTDWSAWSAEMQAYCEEDVQVTVDLYARILAAKPSDQALSLEHEVAWLMARQERNGFPFDSAKAGSLYAVLSKERERLRQDLTRLFDPWFVSAGETIPKRDNKKLGYVAGAPFTRVKLVSFNPTSRAHIADRLQRLYGWKPDAFTGNGQPKVDDKVLKGLPYEPAKQLARYFLIEKRIGQLAEGSQAWLRVVRGGRIHGGVNPNGAVTGRATHSHPNIAQVPAASDKVPYGKECRQLFHAPGDWVLVGADASGLELRCLAHFMARFDGGAYAKELLDGDIHTANQEAAGLPTRESAKRFVYAFLYGAGDETIGQIVDGGRAEGRKLKDKFLKQLPALRHLKDAIKVKVTKKKHLIGLDGRLLHIRSDHAALNTLLQSAGALVCKQWIVTLEQRLLEAGYRHGWDDDFAVCAWVHDEIQIACRKEIADDIGHHAVDCVREAGEHFRFRCPLTGEYKIGKSWAETH